jgi:energy-coupling factor transporter ATP-binding protein EcfA2
VAKEKRTKSAPSSPSGGYFSSLTLSNIRCFGPEQTLRLVDRSGGPAQWTILLGDNGVGKTTVLQALALVTPVRVDTTLGVVPWHYVDDPFEVGLLRAGQHRFHLSAELSYEVQLGCAGGARGLSDLTAGAFGFRQFNVRGSPIFCAAYGGTRRMGSGSLDTPKDKPFATLFDDNAPLRNAEEWLILSDYAANKESAAPRKARAKAELARVKAALVDLLPDVTDIRVELSEHPGGVPRVEVQTPDGWVALRDLSLGYRTTLAWMVDLAARMFEAYPDSKDPLAERAVALIDEIDLHLHPRWQRDLLGHLATRFPRTQFIASAHSPLVVQAAPDANIAVLRREGDHVVIDQEAGSVRGWRVDQILTSDLFGLPSARDPAQDDLRRHREAILGKARLTAKDKAALAAIDAELIEAPGGETPQQMEAMDVILRAATRLKSARGA